MTENIFQLHWMGSVIKFYNSNAAFLHGLTSDTEKENAGNQW